MNRRDFVTSLGAAGIARAGAPAPAAAGPGAARAQVSLHGLWERWVNGVRLDAVEVPSSLRPSGYYRLKRALILPKLAPQQRAIVHFDAINCHGRVFVNGEELGTTVPYVPHEFDLTRQAREGINTLEVAIADLCPEPGGAGADEVWLGVNPGWEGYGGIVRPAYVEIRPAPFIDNVRFGYRLGREYSTADCTATVYLGGGSALPARLRLALRRGGSELARVERSVEAGAATAEVAFQLKDPALWSPESPNLYDLLTTLESAAGADEFRCRTGFRDLVIRDRRFELNGSPLVVNGMCRHDMWKDQGFTLTRAQMQQDMRGIKALGANFVRLVHYPHDRYIVELADELGLLVSEEPGFWGMDFRSMPWSRAELGLRILERTIRRDWNSPSVFAWLLGNESHFTVEYLRKGKELCRALDPIRRPVSIANSMRKEEAKPLCEEGGMDFFDDHPYTFNIAEFESIAAFYGPGKPLLFTEWGGREIGQSEIIMPNTVDKLLDMTGKGVLAGHAFWSWQDLPQFSRIDPEMRDGILESGVVTEAREPRQSVYMELARLYEGRRHTGWPATESPVVLPLARAPWSAQGRCDSVDLKPLVSADPGLKAWADFEARIADFWSRRKREQWDRTGRRFMLWEPGEIEILGVRFACPVSEGRMRPLVLTPDFPEVEIPIRANCRRLHFLGHVTCPGGYPVEGNHGELAASYEIALAGGRKQMLPLRNGIEIARANIVHVATRINPVATDAQRALWFVKDWAREQYQFLLFSAPVEGRVESIRWKLSGPNPMMLLAIATERE